MVRPLGREGAVAFLALPPPSHVGLGSRVPVAPNKTPAGADNPAGRQLNRRVEIVVATG